MTRSQTAFPLVLLGFITLFATACADNTPAGAQFTCRANDTSRPSCLEFVSGWTAETSMSSCNPLASTWSSTASCPSGRIAHCTVSSGGNVYVVNWYAPYPLADAAANCALYPGDYAAN